MALIGGTRYFLGPFAGAFFYLFVFSEVIERTVLWDTVLGVVVLGVALVLSGGLSGLLHWLLAQGIAVYYRVRRPQGGRRRPPGRGRGRPGSSPSTRRRAGRGSGAGRVERARARARRRGPDQELRRARRRQRRQLPRSQGCDPRDHRPERRRQDDALQPHHRPDKARLGPGVARGRRHHRGGALEARQARSRPVVPADEPVLGAFGVDERDHRRRGGEGRHSEAVRNASAGRSSSAPPGCSIAWA